MRISCDILILDELKMEIAIGTNVLNQEEIHAHLRQ